MSDPATPTTPAVITTTVTTPVPSAATSLADLQTKAMQVVDKYQDAILTAATADLRTAQVQEMTSYLDALQRHGIKLNPTAS